MGYVWQMHFCGFSNPETEGSCEYDALPTPNRHYPRLCTEWSRPWFEVEYRSPRSRCGTKPPLSVTSVRSHAERIELSPVTQPSPKPTPATSTATDARFLRKVQKKRVEVAPCTPNLTLSITNPWSNAIRDTAHFFFDRLPLQSPPRPSPHKPYPPADSRSLYFQRI